MADIFLTMPGDAAPQPSEIWRNINPTALWMLLDADTAPPQELVDGYNSKRPQQEYQATLTDIGTERIKSIEKLNENGLALMGIVKSLPK